MKGRGVHFHFHLWLALHFALAVACFGFNMKNQSVKCIPAERRALLHFKKGLLDENNLLASWTSEEEEAECCNWKGVGCNNTTGHVVMLDLGGTFLCGDYKDPMSIKPIGGEIGSSLLELKHLSHLDLSSNFFEKIPKFIGSLTQLTYLNLSSNPLAGFIPHQLGNLSMLLYLDLSNYYYQSLISDNLEWLSHLSSLKLLKIGSTNFTKATNWLQVIGSHPSLSVLQFYHCQFPEVDPSSLSHFSPSNSLSVLHLTLSTLPSLTFPLLLNISRNLVELDFSDNNIGSLIPDSFDNMPYLERITFEQNNLQGGIPKSLGNLCNLKELNLEVNELSGPLTVVVKNLSGCAKDSLESLTLGNNRFDGSLPSFIGNFSKLTVLDLDGNRFTGPLPDLSRLSSLRTLSLGWNRFEGPLPVSMGKMSQLVVLDVSSNSLHGVISETHLFNLTKLRLLFISSNALSFNLSSDWIPPFQLDYIDMRSCELGPKFPSWLTKQTNFSYLDISNSNISDTIPQMFWNLPSGLKYLNLAFNKISGSIPNPPLKFDYSPLIDLSSNLFHGPIPQSFSNLTFLDLSNNMFNETLSFLCTKEATPLTCLDLSNNMLTGGIPDCWIKSSGFKIWGLSLINLENNNLSGVIPSSLGSLERLQSLRLRNTSLYGEIPYSLKNCRELKLLDLGENKLTGIIPTWIGESLGSLIFLRLRSNEFHGDIPSTICRKQSLQVLDLSFNNLSGTIPSSLNNLTAMAQPGSSEVTLQLRYAYPNDETSTVIDTLDDHLLVIWKGVEQEYGKTLGLLKLIDLSCNKLSGQIPQEIASLQGLIALNLSSNMLEGSIIREIGKLKALESLDLSTNNLSGEIPESMSDITFLSVLDLSNNDLSGKIPLSTQLQSFNATSYSGNPRLCGPPLSKCPGDEETSTKSPNHDDTESDEEWFEPLWFFTGMTDGFLVGFWGIFGSLLINRSWRHRYFGFLNKSVDWIRLRMAIWWH